MTGSWRPHGPTGRFPSGNRAPQQSGLEPGSRQPAHPASRGVPGPRPRHTCSASSSPVRASPPPASICLLENEARPSRAVGVCVPRTEQEDENVGFAGAASVRGPARGLPPAPCQFRHPGVPLVSTCRPASDSKAVILSLALGRARLGGRRRGPRRLHSPPLPGAVASSRPARSQPTDELAATLRTWLPLPPEGAAGARSGGAGSSAAASTGSPMSSGASAPRPRHAGLASVEKEGGDSLSGKTGPGTGMDVTASMGGRRRGPRHARRRLSLPLRRAGAPGASCRSPVPTSAWWSGPRQPGPEAGQACGQAGSPRNRLRARGVAAAQNLTVRDA